VRREGLRTSILKESRRVPELICLRFGVALRAPMASGRGPSTRSVPAMPLYFFRIRNGRYSGCSDQATEFADHDAAWKEMTSVCADMAAGIARKLQKNSEWHMELLDEAKEPVFRIRIVAESFD
jgi:hypothetical protein